MYLSDLKVGNKAKVIKVDCNESIKRRLLDIGLIEDTILECTLKSSFGKTYAYLIRGALIALRKEDIDRIKVELA